MIFSCLFYTTLEKELHVQNIITLSEQTKKILISILVVIASLFPLWIWLVCYFTLSPTGYWQNFAMFGAGIFFGGAVQLLLACVAGVFLHFLWKP